MRRGWNKTRSKPSEQCYETSPYSAEILGVFVDTDEQTLAHAQEQLALQRAYPGRGRSLPEQQQEPEAQETPKDDALPRVSPQHKPSYYQQPGVSAQVVRFSPKV